MIAGAAATKAASGFPVYFFHRMRGGSFTKFVFRLQMPTETPTGTSTRHESRPFSIKWWTRDHKVSGHSGAINFHQNRNRSTVVQIAALHADLRQSSLSFI
jgi:hypothetical protein